MNVLWLDPVNSDAQFLNLLSIALLQEGHQVAVRSNRRAAFPPPPEVEWTPFSALRRFPTTLRRRPLTRLFIGATYPLDWMRAVRHARRLQSGAVLVSSSLALAGLDAWGLRQLRRSGVAPVVLVHRPYLNWREEPGKAPAFASFYREAEGLFVMSDFCRRQLLSLYGVDAKRIFYFPHPHFQPLLERYPTDAALGQRLAAWAQGEPVVGFFANMTPEHGLEDLLDALPALRQELGDFRLLLVSRLSERDHSRARQVEERLQREGLEARCWCQWESYSYGELKAYIEATTVAVAPYRWATQSGVIAMLIGMGVPVVATRVGGLPEMVHPGASGELVEPGDARALALATARIAADVDAYREQILRLRDTDFAPSRAAAVVGEALAAHA